MVAFDAPAPAQALNPNDFDPGLIISDAQFYNGRAMTEAQIQKFLDDQIGTCENSNCLNVYRQTTRDLPATERCAGYAGAANEPASRIIFKVQQSCSISAKVILVTLQKEQSLVTSRRPSTSTLERAMGYYCPDDPSRPGWCHPDFAGFFNQVINASGQFQRYRLYPNSFGHRIGTQQVRYHPNAACGSRTVTIRNSATAGLYNYTPYTPNQAAMNNLFGIGDSCSAYGNRNFWRLYTTWFGSTTAPAFAAWNGTFRDDDGNTHEANIEKIYAAGVTYGCNPPMNDRYCPSDSVTRAQMAALLRRALDLPRSSSNAFVDDNGHQLEQDINALADAGITFGCNPPANDRFCPNDSVTREQMAAFLQRAFELPRTSNDFFNDDNGRPLEASINALANSGVTFGCNPPDNTRFCPRDPVKRDQMASFLARALGL